MITVAFINPNSTAMMTKSCAASFQENLPENFDVIPITNLSAPSAIQGPKDGEVAVPGVLEIISSNKCDAYVIGCFDDTGLSSARTLTTKPIIGIGQAAYHLASLMSARFNILTTLAVSVPVIEENIKTFGFKDFCDGVFASGVPVLELESQPKVSCQKIGEHIKNISNEFPSNAIVLGCAGMTNLWNKLQHEFETQLIDPVAAAAKLIPIITNNSNFYKR